MEGGGGGGGGGWAEVCVYGHPFTSWGIDICTNVKTWRITSQLEQLLKY